MLKLCPQCKRLSVEYDFYHHIERCLNRECHWVNRDKKSLGESVDFELPRMKISESLEERNHKKAAQEA